MSVSLRVATYTRASTDESNQPYSLAAQDIDCDRYVAIHPNWTVVHRFSDRKSGATLDRPGLQAALKAIALSDIDILLVARLDRLSRNEMDFYTLRDLFRRSSVTLDSVAEGIDFNSLSGELFSSVLISVAAHERRLLKDRIIKGIHAKASLGRWVGGRPPIGYTVDTPTQVLVEDPSDADVVRTIFRRYTEDGVGAKTIATDLNALGRRTRNDGLWSVKTVLDVLKRPAYAGFILHRGELLPGLHQPLVTRETWDTAQRLLGIRSASSGRVPENSDYLFSGLIRCGWCGSTFVGKSANAHGNHYRYYVCRSRDQYGTELCAAPNLRADRVEEVLLDLVIETYEDGGLFRRAIEEADATKPRRLSGLDTEARALRLERDRVERLVQKYLREFETDVLVPAGVRERLIALESQGGQLADRLAEIDNEIAQAAFTCACPADLMDMASLLRETIAQGPSATVRSLLQILVNRVRVERTGALQPVLNVPPDTSPESNLITEAAPR